MKVLLVAGARPNFMKIAPIYDSVDLLPSLKNMHNILCVIFEHNATCCVLIFKIGVNQQSHI